MADILIRGMDMPKGGMKMDELMNDEIKQAIAQIGEELGAEMIVHNCISVGAKKEIGGETFGNYAVLFDSEIEDGRWRGALDRLKKRVRNNFPCERNQGEAQSKEGG